MTTNSTTVHPPFPSFLTFHSSRPSTLNAVTRPCLSRGNIDDSSIIESWPWREEKKICISWSIRFRIIYLLLSEKQNFLSFHETLETSMPSLTISIEFENDLKMYDLFVKCRIQRWENIKNHTVCVLVEQTFRILAARTVWQERLESVKERKKRNENARKRNIGNTGRTLKNLQKWKRGMYQELRWHFSLERTRDSRRSI